MDTHLFISSLASFPKASMSSLVLLGLIARTSSGSSLISTGPTADESRGTIMVPLLFLLGNGGRMGTGALMVGWSSEDADDECTRSMDGCSWVWLAPILCSKSACACTWECTSPDEASLCRALADGGYRSAFVLKECAEWEAAAQQY